MPTVKFTSADGSEQVVEVPLGWSLMEAARRDGVPGIVAECGGGAICGTCHVHVDIAWYEKLEPADMSELALLEVVPEPSNTSRLACQVIMTEDLAEMCVRIPAEQLAF